LVGEFVATTFTKDAEQEEVSTRLDEDISRLREMVGDIKPALVVIDPITNYLGAVEMNKESEVRSRILMPLSNIAQTFDVCIMTIGHINRRDKDAPLLQRIMGAAAFGGVARDIFAVGPDSSCANKFAHVFGDGRNKSAVTLKYHTEAVKVAWDGLESEVVRVQWDGIALNADMDEAFNPLKLRERTNISEAADLIRALLKEGAKSTQTIEQALKDAGIECIGNLSRACRKAGGKPRKIKGKKDAGGEWYLPTPDQATFDQTQGVTNG
jgi:hypothetical protein